MAFLALLSSHFPHPAVAVEKEVSLTDLTTTRTTQTLCGTTGPPPLQAEHEGLWNY